MASVNKTFEVELDIARATDLRPFTVVEGDTGNRILVTLLQNGAPVSLSGCRVIASFARANGVATQDSGELDGGVTLCGALNNQVDIALHPASFSPGLVECELQIYSDETLLTLVTTARFNFKCRRGIMGVDAVTGSVQYPILSGLINLVEGLQEDVEQSVIRAQAAAAACEALVDGSITAWEIQRYGQEGD